MSEPAMMLSLEDIVYFAGRADTVDDRRKLSLLLQDTATVVEVQPALDNNASQAA